MHASMHTYAPLFSPPSLPLSLSLLCLFLSLSLSIPLLVLSGRVVVMESQRQEWSSAHAQLWTSFKLAQKGCDSDKTRQDTSVDKMTRSNSLLEQHPRVPGREVTSAILREATRQTRLDEPVFPEELESRIFGLIEDDRTDAAVRDLLAAVVHLKNRAEKDGAESIYRQESLAGVVNETLFQLTGQQLGVGSTAAAVVTDEMTSESTEALADIESRLLAVLIQVEKCKETAWTFLEKNCPGKVLSRETSLQEMLNVLRSSCFPASSGASIGDTNSEKIHQIMDILEAPAGTLPDQTPDLVLKVVKELEFARRENHANSVLLLQYERDVMAKFASCGVVSPPTLEQERETLFSKNESVHPSFNHDQWIKGDLEALLSVMREVSRGCQLNVDPLHLREGPDDTSAEAMLKYMRVALSGARELLFMLARNQMQAKPLLVEMAYTLGGTGHEGRGSQATVLNERPFMEIVDELGRLVYDRCEQATPELRVGGRREEKEPSEAMMRIARCLPEEYRMRAVELLRTGGALTDYVEGVVKRLVAAEAADDPLLLQVQQLGSQIAQLTDEADDGSPHVVDQTTLSTLVDTAEQLRLWAMERRGGTSSVTEEAMIQQCLHELAQLLPTGVPPSSPMGSARIDPPVNNLLDMVRLLKQRQEQWIQEQQKQHLTGAQSRLEKTRVEEAVRERGKQLIKISKEILLGAGNTSEMEELLGALSSEMLEELTTASGGGGANSGGGGGSGGGAPFSATTIFDDLEERLKLVKTRHHRLLQSYAANKVRLDNLVQSSAAHGKRFSRICHAVAAICRLVGLERAAAQLERDAKAEAAPTTSKLVLRPEQRKPHAAQPVTDADVLETLKHLEERLKDDGALVDRAALKSETLRLQEEEKRWREETDTFRKAMQVILMRLAEVGRRVKRTLFLLGTDESADDEVVEAVLKEQRRRDEEEVEEGEGADGENDTIARQQKNEESLAMLLQKFGRWSTRLQETTEDHLYTQQKLVKYFAAVHRFFCSTKDMSAQGITDESLIDVDSALMRFADGILPVLDRAIAAAQSSTGGGGGSSTGKDGEKGGARRAALSLLLQDAPSDRVLPMDHRLVRLYEAVGKLRTMVAGLLSVRYLAIPSASRRRGGDAADELTFDDAWGDGYVELDMGKLKDAVSTTSTAVLRTDARMESDNTIHASDDAIIRAVESNIASVYQALGKFSTNYKLAAILMQKDTEMVQQFVADMLAPYAELDVERAFNQDPVVLKEICGLLSERATRQRGCYFFNRVNGEGPCVWAVALEQLSIGFVSIIEKLQKRTQVAAELRELVDDVVDLCAMYVNWVEVNGAPLASSHPMPQDVLDACVREDEDEEVEAVDREDQQQQRRDDKLSKPPLPPNHPRPKVSHFFKDETVLKVIAHMFQVTQEVVNSSSGAKNDENNNGETQKFQQMEEQMQLLRETAAVAEQRASAVLENFKRVEQERDKALSEAAVSRAELRRWKRQHSISEGQSLLPPPQQQALSSIADETTPPVIVTQHHSIPSPLPPDVTSPSSGSAAKDVVLLQVAQSIKELTEELRGACQRGIVSPQAAATTASETHHGMPPHTASERHDAHNRTQQTTPATGAATVLKTRGGTSPRSSGLVLSPKALGRSAAGAAAAAAPRRRSASPRSTSSSSPLQPSTRRSPSPNDGETHLRRQQNVQQDGLPGRCASVVVSPLSPTYSSLARGHTHNSSGTVRVPSAPRYKPCKHHGNFFNECDVCSRRHRGCRPETAARAAAAATATTAALPAASRSELPQQRGSVHAARMPPAATASPWRLKHDGDDAMAGGPHSGHRYHDHGQHQQQRREPHHSQATASSRGKVSPLYTERGPSRTSSAVRERHATASTAASSHSHHEQKQHHGRTSLLPHASYLRSPSTSSVLSPESVITLTEVRAGEQQQPQQPQPQHQHQHRHHRQAHASNTRERSEATTLGASLDLMDQHTAATMTSPSPSPHAARAHTARRRQQQQQQQHGSATSRGRAPHNSNLRSDALKKLADIVAKTKIAGREEP